jgi:hypothetical protein
VQMNKSKQRPKRCSGPRWAHHNPTTTAWRSMAFGGGLRRAALERPLRFGLWRSMAVNRRFRDRSENHGAPGSNPGPATLKTGVLQVKRP